MLLDQSVTTLQYCSASQRLAHVTLGAPKRFLPETRSHLLLQRGPPVTELVDQVLGQIC